MPKNLAALSFWEEDRGVYAAILLPEPGPGSFLCKAAWCEHHTRLLEFFATHPCVDCGEGDPVVLQFDHIRGTKTADVGSMVSGGYPWSRIEAEIAKCDVRCANCHWRKTARQFGWYAFLDSDGG